MFATSLQTSPLSLFSSTSTKPFALFSVRSDSGVLPEDAGIVLVDDATNASLEVVDGDPSRLELREEGRSASTTRGRGGGLLDERVAHLQSPSIQSTYMRCPPRCASDTDTAARLGITLPHLHFQLRPLGPTRPFYIEVGVRDDRDGVGVIRCSSFQTRAKIYYHSSTPPQRPSASQEVGRGGRGGDQEPAAPPPLLHLPLILPHEEERDSTMTEWTTLSLPLHLLFKQFGNPTLLSETQPLSLPPRLGRFVSVDYVQVHATCRLRRIWFTSTPQPHSTHEFSLSGF